MSNTGVNRKDIITICLIPVLLWGIQAGMQTIFNTIATQNDALNDYKGYYKSICSCITYVICIGIFALLYAKRKWDYRSNTKCTGYSLKRSLEKMKQSSPSFFAVITILLLTLGFALQAAVTGILQLITYINPDILSSYNDMINNSFGSSRGILNIFSVALLAPISEELAFRGFGMSMIASVSYCIKKSNYTNQKSITTASTNSASYDMDDSVKPYTLCILIISILFGLYHGNIVQILYAFPMGILLGYFTVLFSTIIPSILLHITINTSAYLLPDILYHTKEMTILTLIISLIYVAAAIFMIHLLSSNKMKN